jgi:hypothetical protein
MIFVPIRLLLSPLLGYRDMRVYVALCFRCTDSDDPRAPLGVREVCDEAAQGNVQ